MITSLLKKAWSHLWGLLVWGVATGVVGGIVLAGINSYLSFTDHKRATVETEYNQLRGTSDELYQLLDAYAAKARSGATVDEGTERKFRQTLLKAYNEAEDVARKEPRAKDEFAEYAKSLILLREAAEFAGPLDARKFVEATSQYIDAKSRLEKKINSIQGNYWRSIFGT